MDTSCESVQMDNSLCGASSSFVTFDSEGFLSGKGIFRPSSLATYKTKQLSDKPYIKNSVEDSLV